MEQRYEDVLLLVLVFGSLAVAYVLGRNAGARAERRRQDARLKKARAAALQIRAEYGKKVTR